MIVHSCGVNRLSSSKILNSAGDDDSKVQNRHEFRSRANRAGHKRVPDKRPERRKPRELEPRRAPTAHTQVGQLVVELRPVAQGRVDKRWWLVAEPRQALDSRKPARGPHKPG